MIEWAVASQYAVVGVLQQHEAPHEWVHVHDIVQPARGLPTLDAAHKAFRRASLDPDRKNQTYQVYATLDQMGTDWNYWVLAVVELEPGLPIADRSGYDDVDQLTEDMPGHDGRLEYKPGGGTQPYSGSTFVAAGQYGGGDAFVQRFGAYDVKNAEGVVEDWFEGDPANGWEPPGWGHEANYGYVEATPDGRYRVYDGERNLIDEVQGAASTGKIDPEDIRTINRHRATMGMAPIDLGAGWTAREIRDMAHSIHTTGKMSNPRAGGFLRGLATAALAGLGIGGVVLGARALRDD